MKGRLAQLARSGQISWLSYYFAEFIARRAQCDIDSVVALSAALVSEANRSGDVCVDLDAHAGKPWFDADQGDDTRCAPATAEWREILSGPCVGNRDPLTLDCGRLYLNRYWRYESEVARQLLARSAGSSTQMRSTTSPASGAGDAEQNAAVSMATDRRFCVISGGPGSGKTSTVIRILAHLLDHDPGLRIGLAAPTGRAAARMMESIQRGLQWLDADFAHRDLIPHTASTIHRLLGYRRSGFEHGRDHPLTLDCVVVDEASMIDLQLMYHLLDALPERARLILLGDRDQLASVAAGNVLGDITGHGLDTTQTASPLANCIALLRRNYRFEAGSAIGELATRVNQGDAAAVLSLLRSASAGLRWNEDERDTIDSDALALLLDDYQAVFDCGEPADALRLLTRTRLLCATNHGPLGVIALNRQISSLLLSRRQLAESELFHGLPIMITRNQHELSLYNGDTGVLWQSKNGLRACFADADGGVRSLSLNRLPEFEPAWAITVHKAQGSEYDSVMLILPADADNELLTRELLYTAITRARQSFRLHAGKRVLEAALGRLTLRRSGLADRLGWSG